MEEFIRLPVVKSPFFNNKLAFALDYDATLKAGDGGIELRLKTPKLLPIAARLRAKSKEVPQDILADRTLICAIEKDLAVIVNLPSPGQYYLDLYIAGDFSARSMDNACAFMIHCSGISKDANMTFPLWAHLDWPLTPVIMVYPLKATQTLTLPLLARQLWHSLCWKTWSCLTALHCGTHVIDPWLTTSAMLCWSSEVTPSPPTSLVSPEEESTFFPSLLLTKMTKKINLTACSDISLSVKYPRWMHNHSLKHPGDGSTANWWNHSRVNWRSIVKYVL